ncbi:MAG: hypothetical protein FWF23_02540 [Alphaproteobacteria bacterium]|nr:hypothetical protein [Alphaproteobacteria bacterium]MCL2505381.1 hypothetical protein [Alphaproteobacteria bacterium]
MQFFEKFKKSSAGFTLTETAIVLALIVALLSAIWIAASAAQENKRVYSAAQSVADVVTDTRIRYVNKDVGLKCEKKSIIQKLLDDDVIDKNWVNMNSSPRLIETAVGRMDVMTSSSVCAGNYPLRIFVFLKDLTPAMCTKMLFSKIDYKDTTLGITQVCVGNEDPPKCWKIDCKGGICKPEGEQEQWSLADVQEKCGAGRKGFVTNIGWEFKLTN